MNTEDYVLEIKEMYDLTDSTAKLYYYSLKMYSELHQKSIEDLLKEAEEEEDMGIRLKHRSIKKRLLDYRVYLLDNYKKTSAQLFLSELKSFYRFYEIDLPKIPTIRDKNNVEDITQIPTIDHVRQAVNNTKLFKVKALILFMFSSGCARREVLNLTVKDFMEATSEYHDEYDVNGFIQKMKKTHNVVPTFHIVRQKTRIPYYTFCTPEATSAIVKYMEREQYNSPFSLDEQLFRYSIPGFDMAFCRVNKFNGWDDVNDHHFFRSHSLRKLFATTLTRARVDPVTIHFLMGHKVDTVTGAYMKVDPVVQKEKYMEIMHFFGVNEITKYDVLENSEREELVRLRRENKDFDRRISEMEDLFRSL